MEEIKDAALQDVVNQKLENSNSNVEMRVFMYKGAGDPVKHLDYAISQYVKNDAYSEFIDANMDNPWVRVIIKGLNNLEWVDFQP